jgi:hypothetical protein
MMKAVLNPITRSAELTYGDETIDLFFDELDEWTEVTINGTKILVHFDYQPRNDFGSQKDWLSYMLQAYPSTDDNQYDNQLINNITLEL